MEVFYIAVLTIATATLILILTSVGVLIRKSKTEAPWPPTAGRCPDFWTEVSEEGGNKGKCYHTGLNKGIASTESDAAIKADAVATAIDFKSKTTCENRTWAIKYQVDWDGVSNYNKCP